MNVYRCCCYYYFVRSYCSGSNARERVHAMAPQRNGRMNASVCANTRALKTGASTEKSYKRMLRAKARLVSSNFLYYIPFFLPVRIYWYKYTYSTLISKPYKTAIVLHTHSPVLEFGRLKITLAIRKRRWPVVLKHCWPFFRKIMDTLTSYSVF